MNGNGQNKRAICWAASFKSQPPPAGAVVIFDQGENGCHLFLSPLGGGGCRPCITIQNGHPSAGYVRPEKVASAARTGWLQVSQRTAALHDVHSEHRLGIALARRLSGTVEKDLSVSLHPTWRPEFMAWKKALGLLEDLWVSVGGPDLDLNRQESLALEFMGTARTFTGMFPSGRGQLPPGIPNTPEKFARAMAVLLYWGHLWRLRKEKPGRVGIDRFGAIAWDECARCLNLLFNPEVRACWGAEWEPFTAGSVRGIVQRQELEQRLWLGR